MNKNFIKYCIIWIIIVQLGVYYFQQNDIKNSEDRIKQDSLKINYPKLDENNFTNDVIIISSGERRGITIKRRQ